MRFCYLLVPAFLAMFAYPASLVAASQLETVIVFGERDDRLLRETSSTVNSVKKDLIASPKLEHIQQLMQTVPGVWVSRGGGQEHLTAIRSPVFTGAGGCGAFGMTEDGISLFANGFCNANQLLSSHYEAAKTIDVYKGPHISLVGGNAQFGAINVHLPNAREVDDQVTAMANTQNFRRLTGQIGRASNENASAALFSFTEDGGFREQSGFTQQKVSLKHSTQTEMWTSVDSGLSVMHLEQETAGYLKGKDAYKDPKLSEKNPNPEAYRDADGLRLFSRFKHREVDAEWMFTPYFRHNDMNFLMHFVAWQPVEESSQDSLGWQLQWSQFLAQGSKLFWGQEFDQTWASLTEVQERTSPISPALIPIGVHYDYGVSAQNAALYGGGFWQSTSNLGVDASVRLDYVRYDYNNNAADGSVCAAGVNCRFYRPADRVDEFLQPSAHLGAIYQITNQIYTFSRLARSFRAPQAAELYRAQSLDISSIKSEKTHAFEIGVRAEQEHSFFQLALYAMRNEDGIIQDTQRRYVNGINSRHIGAEYEFQYGDEGVWTVGASGQFAAHTYRNNPNLLGSGAVTQLRGLQFDTAPKQEHSLRTQWWPIANVRLNAQWFWQGKYYLDPENKFVYEGHQLLDMDASWEINKALQVQASVLNVLDKRYAERADISFGEYQYFPGLERRLALSLTYKF